MGVRFNFRMTLNAWFLLWIKFSEVFLYNPVQQCTMHDDACGLKGKKASNVLHTKALSHVPVCRVFTCVVWSLEKGEKLSSTHRSNKIKPTRWRKWSLRELQLLMFESVEKGIQWKLFLPTRESGWEKLRGNGNEIQLETGVGQRGGTGWRRERKCMWGGCCSGRIQGKYVIIQHK